MRVSDNITKSGVIAHAIFAISFILTTVMAAFHVFGARVLDRTWARFIVIVALVGAVYLGSSRDFYAPHLGVNVIPTTALKQYTPTDASVAVTVDAPDGAVYALYWASKQSTLVFESPAAAYSGYENSGVVPVAGGRATLRLGCPGVYKSSLGRVVPRHVHCRFVFPNGAMTSVKTLPVRCP